MCRAFGVHFFLAHPVYVFDFLAFTISCRWNFVWTLNSVIRLQLNIFELQLCFWSSTKLTNANVLRIRNCERQWRHIGNSLPAGHGWCVRYICIHVSMYTCKYCHHERLLVGPLVRSITLVVISKIHGWFPQNLAHISRSSVSKVKCHYELLRGRSEFINVKTQQEA